MPELEQRLPRAFSLQAAQRNTDAADRHLDEEIAKAGLEYFVSGRLGPRTDSVTATSIDFQPSRYAAQGGVRIPLFGTRIAQQGTIEAARTETAIARIDYAALERERLANLRRNFVLYWQYDREAALAQMYLSAVQHDLPAALSLRRAGFWTQGAVLDFLDSLARGKTDLETLQTSQRAAFVQLESVLGTSLVRTSPMVPSLGLACSVTPELALARALKVDAVIAKLDADISKNQFTLRQVRFSSVSASANVGLTQAAMIPPAGFRYGVAAGIDVAMPVHAKRDERAVRAKLVAQLDRDALEYEQRRLDLRSLIEQQIDQIGNSRVLLAQAATEEKTRRENLREARVRFRTIPQDASAAFDDVQTKSAELYLSEKNKVAAQSQVFLSENELLLISPGVCSSAGS
ncbi:MAG: hypothetical protein NVS2B17_05880 [Candidatus Velthaea sp.]